MKPVNAPMLYRRGALCAALVVLAIVLPRFMPSQEGGLAAAAGAVLLFLALLLAAWIVALWMLAGTLAGFRELGPGARIVGILPAIVLGAGLLVLVVMLRY